MPRYRELPPHPALGRWVRCYWFLQQEPGPDGAVEPILPDGCCELIFHRGDRNRRWRPLADRPELGRFETEPQAVLVSELEGPVHVSSGARVDTVGVRFRPGGARRFFSAPPRELVGRSIDLALLWRDAPAVLDRLSAGGEPPAVAALLDRLLVARRVETREDWRIDHLLGRLHRSSGHLSISRLAADAGVSTRHLERLLTPAVGMPPKRLARVTRFHAAFRALLDGDADRAFRGYFDHSHLLRDFREFARLPPTALLGRDLELNRCFAQRPGG